MNTLQNVGMSHQQALSTVDAMINGQAFTMSAVDVFYASAIIFLALTGLVWFARPKSAKAGGGGAAEAAAGARRAVRASGAQRARPGAGIIPSAAPASPGVR